MLTATRSVLRDRVSSSWDLKRVVFGPVTSTSKDFIQLLHCIEKWVPRFDILYEVPRCEMSCQSFAFHFLSEVFYSAQKEPETISLGPISTW